MTEKKYNTIEDMLERMDEIEADYKKARAEVEELKERVEEKLKNK